MEPNSLVNSVRTVYVVGNGDALRLTEEIWQRISPWSVVTVSDLSDLDGNDDVRNGIVHLLDYEGNHSDLLHVCRNGAKPALTWTPRCVPRLEPALRDAFPKREHGSLFLCNRYVYHPLFMEIKRILLERRLGDYTHGEVKIRHHLESWPGWWVELLLWLFGIPIETIIEKSRTSNLCGVLSYCEKAYLAFKIIQSPDISSSDYDSAYGTLFFDHGKLSFHFGDMNRVVIYPEKESMYHLPLPEGDGFYYFILDVYESVTYNRESYIFPSDEAMRNFSSMEKFFRRYLDMSARKI